MIARLRSLGIGAIFGIAMFSLGGVYVGTLMVLGEQFIRSMSGGWL